MKVDEEYPQNVPPSSILLPYVAANCLFDLGGIPRDDRRVVVTMLECFLTTYRAVLAGEHPAEQRRFGVLAQADLQEGGRS